MQAKEKRKVIRELQENNTVQCNQKTKRIGRTRARTGFFVSVKDSCWEIEGNSRIREINDFDIIKIPRANRYTIQPG
jgi:hypothetical protein